MANLKFSGFTANAAVDQADSFLVGFDTDGGGLNPTNNKWTFPQIATGLAAVTATPYSIYAADGTIGSGRVATVTDTLTFNNSSNQNILKISNEVCIGQIAVAGGNTTVAIGLDARATGGSTTAVGSYAKATNGNSSAFGHNASTAKIGALVIGYYSKSLGDYGVSVGYACGAANGTAANVINIGRQAKGEGANSITFASNGSSTAPTTANAFGVYMTSNTTPDFEVVGSGTSTLNTNFKITGIGAAGDYIIKNAGNDADAYTVYMTDGTGQANVGAYGGINFISRYGSIGSTASYNNLGVWTFERNVVIKGQAYTELHDTANTTLTVDWDDSNIQELTGLTGSHTFTASNPKAGATYILTLAQTGTVTATWTGVKWPADTPPTLSGAGKTDVITLICYDATGAGLYYGASTLNFTT